MFAHSASGQTSSTKSLELKEVLPTLTSSISKADDLRQCFKISTTLSFACFISCSQRDPVCLCSRFLRDMMSSVRMWKRYSQAFGMLRGRILRVEQYQLEEQTERRLCWELRCTQCQCFETPYGKLHLLPVCIAHCSGMSRDSCL